MNMTSQEDSLTAKQGNPKTRWLSLLEQVLKARVGWVDEAISPFTRRVRADKAKPKIREAA